MRAPTAVHRRPNATAADTMEVQLTEPIKSLVRLGMVGVTGLEPAASSL
jgi:hypothetical protein